MQAQKRYFILNPTGSRYVNVGGGEWRKELVTKPVERDMSRLIPVSVTTQGLISHPMPTLQELNESIEFQLEESDWRSLDQFEIDF